MPKIDITLAPAEVAALTPKHTALESVSIWVIRQFLESLPMKRDWLDPALEGFTKELLTKPEAVSAREFTRSQVALGIAERFIADELETRESSLTDEAYVTDARSVLKTVRAAIAKAAGK